MTAMRLSDIADLLSELTNEQEAVSVGHVLEKLGNRSYAPFLIVPAAIEISPIGGLPGVPTFLAIIILIVAGQMAYGQTQLWLPKFVQHRSLSSKNLSAALNKLTPLINKMDSRFSHARLPSLTQSPVTKLAALACMLLALTVPPLEFIPFASTAPMLAIALIGLALLVHDGWLMLVALTASTIAFATIGILLT